jgi:hypothetical protein
MSKDNQWFVNLLMVCVGTACLVAAICVVLIFVDAENRKVHKGDEMGLAVGCIAVTLTVGVIPFQLAPLIEKSGSHRFHKIVHCGMLMCIGSLFFIAGTVLRFAFLKWPPVNPGSDTPWTVWQIITYWGSCILFICGSTYTALGFYFFVEQLAFETIIRGPNQDGSDTPSK